jgi:DNA-binding response OmpR family regulator
MRGTPYGMPLVFVVEDDADVSRLICHHLGNAGYVTRWFTDSSSVVEEAEKTMPSLFLLDIALPGNDGFDLCCRIRETRSLARAGIIFVTAKSSERDRVKGFELGGDDYVTKPFSPRELVARIGAVLRGSPRLAQPNISRFGQIEINPTSMTVKVAGEIVPTTVREFSLLEYISRHASRVFTREQLLAAVWPQGSLVTPRSVDVFMRRLRGKIEPDPGSPTYLKTVRGTGYLFEKPKEQES